MQRMERRRRKEEGGRSRSRSRGNGKKKKSNSNSIDNKNNSDNNHYVLGYSAQLRLRAPIETKSISPTCIPAFPPCDATKSTPLLLHRAT